MSGVYISYPFCRQKCTYCNFASGVFSDDLRGRYLAAVAGEIERTQFAHQPETLYLGGGTPSLLEPDEIEAWLAVLPGDDWGEATIEVAPGDLTPERARTWARLGMNRVSLGVQSFNEDVVRASGRKHDARVVEDEVAMLRSAGLGRINVDLIAGLSLQTEQSWKDSLEWVERLGVRHVSVYMLEEDDDSRLGAEIRRGGSRYGAGRRPSDEQTADFYLMAVERLNAMGIERYEISNFAAPGEESAHNLKYWTMQPYVGFGADAHSFDGGRRWANPRNLSDYLERWETGGELRASDEILDPERLVEDRLMTGLRTRDGVALTAGDWARYQCAAEGLAARGWLTIDSDLRIRLTDEGVMVSNEVLGELLFSQEPTAP